MNIGLQIAGTGLLLMLALSFSMIVTEAYEKYIPFDCTYLKYFITICGILSFFATVSGLLIRIWS